MYRERKRERSKENRRAKERERERERVKGKREMLGESKGHKGNDDGAGCYHFG